MAHAASHTGTSSWTWGGFGRATGFADADAGAEHESDQVGQVGLDGAVVGGEALAEERDFLGGEGSGRVLGFASMVSTSRTGSMEVAP